MLSLKPSDTRLSTAIRRSKDWDEQIQPGQRALLVVPDKPPRAVTIATACFVGLGMQLEVFVQEFQVSVPCALLRPAQGAGWQHCDQCGLPFQRHDSVGADHSLCQDCWEQMCGQEFCALLNGERNVFEEREETGNG